MSRGELIRQRVGARTRHSPAGTTNPVSQKNRVYVAGLSAGIPEQDILWMLWSIWQDRQNRGWQQEDERVGPKWAGELLGMLRVLRQVD